MNREEEIKRYCKEQGFPYGACSSISSLKAEIATDAIKWADKTMIVKACKWMKQWKLQLERAPMIRLIDDEMIEDFKKAMEK